MSNKVAQLTLNGKTIDLPIHSGTLGPDVIAISALRDHDVFTIDPGFFVTASCESSITFIDGDKGQLLYRGYPIDQLADQCDFMEVAHLLLFGELPTEAQSADWLHTVDKHTMLHEQVYQFVNGFRRDAHPMAIMVGVVGALSGYYHDTLDIKNAAHRELSAIRLIAKMPTIAAMCYKYMQGQPFVYPDNELDYASNFLNMLFSIPADDEGPDPVLARAMDRIFTLHADHEQNASTSTVRLASSTGANPYACISAGIGALWGPAHGGANEACLRMLQQIGDEKHIGDYIKKAKDPNDPFRLMGFGHRVYKNYDPRAKVMQQTCHEVLEATDSCNTPLFKLAMKLEKIAREDEYFVTRNLYPNVDFYSGLTLNAIGIPSNMFTVIFALARTTGWVAHWLEMMNDPNRRLGRPRQLYTGAGLRDVPPRD